MTTQQQSNLQALLGRLQGNTLTFADQQVLGGVLNSIIATWGFGGTGAPPDLLAYGGQSDESNARAWFAILYEMAQSISGGTPVIPTSWTVPNWFIDPVGGSDLNAGTTVGAPLKTWAQLVNLWGTNAPRLRQNTTITFLNSQPDATDPIYFNPYIENAAVVLQGVLGAAQQVAAGVLAGTVAKNRATNTPLQSNSGATAINQLIVNATHPARAFTAKNQGAGVFLITQPIVAPIVPSALVSVTEVDTWVNGDAVTVFAPISIHVGQLKPIISQFQAGFTNLGLFVYQLNCAPLNANGGLFYCNPSVAFVDSVVTSSCLMEGTSRQGLVVAQCNACFQDLHGGPQQGATPILAGRWDFGRLNSVLMGADCVVGIGATGNGVEIAGAQPSFFGTVYVDTAATLNLSQSARGDVNVAGSTIVMYGPGTLNLRTNSRLNYPLGAGAAVAAFPIAGGITLNGSTACWLSKTAAGPTGGKTVSAANLDADLGAAAGAYMDPGGSSVSNAAA